MTSAQSLAVGAAGLYFLIGLLTGGWKYAHVLRSTDHRAPRYVDIAHRAALMYAFACLVIERFVTLSALPDGIEFWAVAAQIVFFGIAIVSYIAHGALRDTDNQFAPPHRLGRMVFAPTLVQGFMALHMIGEIGGFGTLLYGAYLMQ